MKKLISTIKKGETTMPKRVVLRFPVDLPKETLKDEEALQRSKEALILVLLQKREISQGKAAELLEISRHDLFDLMAKYNIPMIDMTFEELQKELNSAKEIFREK